MKVIQVAVPSKAYVCRSWTAGIVGSNPAKGMDVRLLCLLGTLWVAASVTADHSFRGVLTGVCVCGSNCV
jgi:hypothetical protein